MFALHFLELIKGRRTYSAPDLDTVPWFYGPNSCRSINAVALVSGSHLGRGKSKFTGGRVGNHAIISKQCEDKLFYVLTPVNLLLPHPVFD